jgi:hypothetical protein
MIVNDRLEGGKSDPHWTTKNPNQKDQMELFSSIEEIGLQPEKEVWYFSSMGRIPEITFHTFSLLIPDRNRFQNTIIYILTTILVNLYKIWKKRNIIAHQEPKQRNSVDHTIFNDGLAIEEIWAKIESEYQIYVEDFQNQVADTTKLFPEEPPLESV